MKYVIANWKMAPATRERTEELLRTLAQNVREVSRDISVVLCPPFVWLPLVSAASFSWKSVLGAQDIAVHDEGAFTGEISPAMLKSIGVSYVIVGHSERRALGESNEIVAQKLQAVLRAGLKPVLCIGETNREGDWHTLLREQIDSALAVISNTEVKELVVAYEPVWAIGKDKPDTPDNVLTAALLIRKCAQARFGKHVITPIPVLYGGSISPQSISPFALQEGIDGVLVGRASLDAQQFAQIIQAMKASNF